MYFNANCTILKANAIERSKWQCDVWRCKIKNKIITYIESRYTNISLTNYQYYCPKPLLPSVADSLGLTD